MSVTHHRLPRWRIVVWLAAMMAALVVVGQTRFATDLSAFLPADPDPAQQLLVDQLKNGPAGRMLLLGIETPALSGAAGVGRRAALSNALATALRSDAAIASVANGDREPGSADEQLLFGHRYLLGDAVEAGRLTTAGLREAIEDSLAQLATPSGIALRQLLARDPTGEILRLVDRMVPASVPASAGGVWASADGRRALLLVQLTADGTALDRQQAALEQIDAAFRTVRGATDDARLLVSGAARFAIESRDRIRADVERLSLVGGLLILIVLLAVYRSPRLLLAGLVPVVSGALVAIATVSLVFGEIHGVTLGFGIALMGEALDYAIYVFVQGRRPGMWQTLRLGVLTSLVGFGALLLSGFPGLAQLGLFASVGILAAALVSGGLLAPAFTAAPVSLPPAAGRRLQRLFTGLARLRPLPTLAGLAALAVLAGQAGWSPRPFWQADLAALSPVGEAAATLDASMREDLKAPDLRYVIIAVRPDGEAALAAAHAIEARLLPLVDQGLIAGFESPSRLLPDAATQLQRRAGLPDAATLRQRLDEATRDLPLPAARLQPFIADVAAARELAPLRPADFNGTALATALTAMLIPGPDRVTAVLPLRAPAAGPNPGLLDTDAIRARLPAGSTLIDVKQETDRLYRDYLREATLLAAAGLALIVLLMVLLRPHQTAAAVFDRAVLPLAAALLVTVAGLSLAGIPLSLLHLVGILLTVAVGSNYALFFLDDDPDPRLLAAVLLANLTTTIGYGILAFASAPVLAAVGQTVGPGAILSMLFCACRRPAPTGAPGLHTPSSRPAGPIR